MAIMERATISQLKDRLSAYIKKVRAGRTILIVDRDEPVARLERIPPGADADDRLTRLERAGTLRRGKGRIDVASLRRTGPAPTRADVLGALVDDRREGR
jgi:antitoxin (DNA-binding transcriptional repressor) of toxin-antitoxin stability system